MPSKKKLHYRTLSNVVRLFYKKRAFEGMENLPEEPCVVVANHSKTHSPITCELYHPRKKRVWCEGRILKFKSAPKYIFDDFWSAKPKWRRWVYKLASYVLSPVAVYIFTNADTLPVYRDVGVVKTYSLSVKALENGEDVVIFPEQHKGYNNVINDFQERFVDLARCYYNRTGKKLAFVPTYNAVKLKKVVFGKPIYYDPDMPISAQRKYVCNYLKGQITTLAESLPKHTVVPYENLPKRRHLSNRQKTEEQILDDQACLSKK